MRPGFDGSAPGSHGHLARVTVSEGFAVEHGGRAGIDQETELGAGDGYLQDGKAVTAIEMNLLGGRRAGRGKQKQEEEAVRENTCQTAKHGASRAIHDSMAQKRTFVLLCLG